MTDRGKQCIKYIDAIYQMCKSIVDDIQDAKENGLDEHEFKEGDLSELSISCYNLYAEWKKMPNIKNAVINDRPVACHMEYKGRGYPCGDCNAFGGGCCHGTGDLLKELQVVIKG